MSATGTAFKRVLMCRPNHFQISYKINPWMGGKVDQNRAIKQWEHLKLGLQSCGIQVDVIDQVEGLPDMVFICNAGLFYLSHFRHSERQGERVHYERWAKENAFNVVGDTKYHFEGGGDAFFQHPKLLIAGTGGRTNPIIYNRVHDALAGRDIKVMQLEMIDEKFYHLGIGLCTLSDDMALWFPPAFSPRSQQILRTSGINLLAVSQHDTDRFVCNAIATNKTVFLPADCDETSKLLRREGFNIYECDTSEFLKAGGSCEYMVLKLE